jgi:RHS repeat-associated protein
MGCRKLNIINKEFLEFGFYLSVNQVSRRLESYRYSFNGKEKDSEGMGGGQSTYDYGFRIYNPAIARFLSVDPLSKELPWNSTYSFAENDVIRSIDLEGAEKYVVIRIWNDGKYFGTLALYLPDIEQIRLYRGDHPNANSTMILNLDLTNDQIQTLRGDIFVYREVAGVREPYKLTNAVNHILFDFREYERSTSRRPLEDASFVSESANLSERRLCEQDEAKYNRGDRGHNMRRPLEKFAFYNFDKINTESLSADILSVYSDFLENNPDYNISVTGNTDKFGTEAYNLNLGYKRANDVKSFLSDQGILKTRMSVYSNGEGQADQTVSSPDDEQAKLDRNVKIQWEPNR